MAGKSLDTSAQFQTASVSKVFTSAAILQLVERKKLMLNDPVKSYLNAFPYPEITIRHLLTHTSGLPDVEIYDTLLTSDPERIIKNTDLISALQLSEKPLHFIPGTKFDYCNTGYQLLALLVEKISGRTFSDYLQRNIFRPAYMYHSYLRAGLQGLPVKDHTIWPMYTVAPAMLTVSPLNGISPFEKHLYYDTHTMGATYGDQNIIATTGDLLRFEKALISGKLFSRSLFNEAVAPLTLNDGRRYTENNQALGGNGSAYGFGWETHIAGNDTTIGHSGYNRGIYVQYYIDLKNDRTIILFDNTEGPSFLQKFLNVLCILKGQPVKKVDLRSSAVRLYGRDLLEGDPEIALIHLNIMRLDTANYRFTPQQMNQLGYDFLRSGLIDRVMETFKINLLLFPQDFNRYDSYGDALLAAGKKAAALAMYEQALSLNPGAVEVGRKIDKLR
ncbi:CubicO group peptidase (beta-lactamase class C family) [Mucilaginibacter oryzae]|uniref:CubicO group peptidase (Beta-lactamase class C family) n=1 Tax=Mucilaginibacter oryzae TaxID=468058 RepID=A0A316HAR1_9SPHI|nr:serine hydrolase domain-containing protein [Mucilaginibacter oryzae]PWK77060.1 CubicO group peptidase (beta-lactamase class C family) [Mucilaginibacter oryzae]